MRQLVYVSESYVGNDVAALDRLMRQAVTNNAIDGVTGLLWTDGIQFAQVVEGDERAMAHLIERLNADERHGVLRVVWDRTIDVPQFGSWAMNRPTSDPLAEFFEARMEESLARADQAAAADFLRVITDARY